eukprot:TRINITY_DN1362_c0_g1_i1.p1 TRINITY_DN1362_c0_g1~~TRINITY_DN1362_c0_g1_i1.p1  ORF type:complete len:296 (-),score=88.71 TRINITY_DN1362_c0_g1_i1:43-930(-)
MADADVLFETRTFFHIGNYQGSINAGQKANVRTDAARTERDVLYYRAMVAQGNYAQVMDEIGASPKTLDLQAVRLLAQYMSNPSGNQEAVLATLKTWTSDGQSLGNPTVQIVGGTIYMQEQSYEDGMKVMKQSSTLEGMSMMVLSLLKIDRMEIAEKELARMKSVDEDATITQLTQAWYNIALGGEKAQEASYIFKDICDRYTDTPLLLNGQAASSMALKKWEEAERFLLDATEKNPKDPDTIANLITCLTHLRKQDTIPRYLGQLRSVAPTHPWTAQVRNAEDSFERNAARFAI